MKRRLFYILIAFAFIFVQTNALEHSFHHHDCDAQHECEQCHFINHFSSTDASLNQSIELPVFSYTYEIAINNKSIDSFQTSAYHSQAPPLLYD